MRNSLHRKKKVKRKKLKDEQQPQAKPAKISGFDFRAWDKFDVVSESVNSFDQFITANPSMYRLQRDNDCIGQSFGGR